MTNSTTATYEIKRKILGFSNKLTKSVGQVQSKFVQDMIYGLAKLKSVLLSNISDALLEPIKKINTIKRLSNNLTNDFHPAIKNSYNIKPSIFSNTFNQCNNGINFTRLCFLCLMYFISKF